jgi:hypothetical protein
MGKSMKKESRFLRKKCNKCGGVLWMQEHDDGDYDYGSGQGVNYYLLKCEICDEEYSGCDNGATWIDHPFYKGRDNDISANYSDFEHPYQRSIPKALPMTKSMYAEKPDGLIFVDLETGGLEPQENAIVDMAFAVTDLDGNNISKKMDS